MSLKNKAVVLLERQLIKQATVLEVRAWQPNTFFEIDLHVPDAEFSPNKGIMHMKCRVAALSFRDYTIAGWDAETKTCTLFVDAGHDGEGSAWAKTLSKKQETSYLKMQTHRYQPLENGGSYLFMGDQSTVGHFLALKQFAGENKTLTGALIIANDLHRRQFKYDHPELDLQSIPLKGTHCDTMLCWVQQQPVLSYDGIYLAGNSQMVIGVRQQLKRAGVAGHRVKAQGFW